MMAVLQSLLNRLETLSAMKVEAMERIVQRDGVGRDIEQLILIDANIYDTIQLAKTIVNALAREPPSD